MRLFGLEITKAAPQPVPDRGWMRIAEPFSGAWQRNQEIDLNKVRVNPVVFRCMSLISGDVAKLPLRVVRLDSNGIWTENKADPYRPLLRKPNGFQNRIQFVESWVLSRLSHGNVYVLKRRDRNGKVVALTVLDPTRVRPLVSDLGNVFYELRTDKLAQITADTVVVPASEIIHDRVNTLYHPLVGIAPLMAAAISAHQGLTIQEFASKFFGNAARPGGLLIAPGRISQQHADELRAYWAANYNGENVGRVAVIGDGMTYQEMSASAVNSQLVEQLRFSDDIICTAFGVPGYKVGIGQAPSFNNVEALQQQYYNDCLQAIIEGMEAALDDGLDYGDDEGVEFDTLNLLRMDTAALVKTWAEAGKAGIAAPNESRRSALNLPPVKGGETPYLQQQNFSLEALAERDQGKPFAKPAPPPAPAPANDDGEGRAARKALLAARIKGLVNEH